METLPKGERLRGRDRIGELFEAGGRGSSGPLAARALANGLSHSRLAAVAGKACGNAVLRNRLRRRIRAAFRINKGAFPSGYDLAVLARRELAESEWRDVAANLRRAVEKAIRSAAGRRPPGLPA